MEIEPVKSDVGMKWEMVRLEEVCQVVGGTTPSTRVQEYWDGDIIWLSPVDLPEVGVISDVSNSIRKITIKGLQNNGLVLLPENSVVFSTRASIGKIGVVKTPLCTNQGFTNFIPSSKIDSKYLAYVLKANIPQIEKLGNTTTFKEVSRTAIKNFQIPLPPLPIQRRIVKILDAADALRRKDQELLQKYDELAQAIFIDMFGDPVKNEKGFKFVMLGDCLDNIQIGPFGTQLHESDYIKNGIPVINPMHIGDLKIKPNYNYSISEEKYYELPQYHLKENDIILGRRGEMGRCAIVTKNQGKCLCGTGSLYLTVKNELLDPLFLVYVLSRKSTKIALENVSAGTTMANLNKSIINDFKIILPNIEKQRDFVKAVKLSEESIEHTMGLIDKSAIIFNSLLQKAFKGELEKE